MTTQLAATTTTTVISKNVYYKNLRSASGTVTFTAGWIANTYTIYYYDITTGYADDGHTKVYTYINNATYYGQRGTVTATYDSNISLRSSSYCTTAVGATFKGWMVRSSTYSSGTTWSNTSSVKAAGYTYSPWKTTNSVYAYATYQLNTYKVKIVLGSQHDPNSWLGDPGTYVTAYDTSTKTFTYGTAYNVAAPKTYGYTFNGWSVTGLDTKTHYYGSSSSVTSTSTNSSLNLGSSYVYFKNLNATQDAEVTFTAKWGNTNNFLYQVSRTDNWFTKLASYMSSEASITLQKKNVSSIRFTYEDPSSWGEGFTATNRVSVAASGSHGSGYITGAANLSVFAYFAVDSSDSTKYKIVIRAMNPNYPLVFPNDSSYLFSDEGNNNGFTALTEFVSDISLNLGNVTTMQGMFYQARELTTVDVSYWNVSNVTNASRMFDNCNKLETLDVSNWNTSNFETIFVMFNACMKLTELRIENWDSSNIENISNAFRMLYKVTRLDFSKWDTSKVTDMSMAFYNSTGLEYLNLSGWDTSNVTDMSYMFSDIRNISSLDLSHFDTSKVTDMAGMFRSAKFEYINTSTWNTSKVTTMFEMFKNSSSLKELDVSKWDTSKVTDMSYMFYSCDALTKLDVIDWNIKQVTTLSNMFYSCDNLEMLNVSKWNTSNVTLFDYVFSFCRKLKELDVSGWDTSKATTIRYIFGACNEVKALDVSNWDTRNVTSMSYAFMDCKKVKTLDVSKWNTSKVTEMSSLFSGCESVTHIDASSFDTSLIRSQGCTLVFYGCSSLEVLDISNFDFSIVSLDLYEFMGSCSSLKVIYAPKAFIEPGISNNNITLPTGMDWTYYYEDDMTEVGTKLTPTSAGRVIRAGYVVTATTTVGSIANANGWTPASDSLSATKIYLFDDVLMSYGKYEKLPVVNRTGYTVDSWVYGAAIIDESTNVASSAHTISVHAWNANLYGVLVNLNGGTTSSFGESNYYSLVSAEVIIGAATLDQTKPGYFNEIYISTYVDEIAKISTNYKSFVSNGIVYYVAASENLLKIGTQSIAHLYSTKTNLIDAGKEIISQYNSYRAGFVVPFDVKLTINVPVKPGYVFAGWNISGMGSVSHKFYKGTSLQSGNNSTTTKI